MRKRDTAVMNKILQCRAHTLELKGAQVMGVINVTPDSFFQGSRKNTLNEVAACAESMLAAGAKIIDIGGESTRPGADFSPSRQEEIDRVCPAVDYISNQLGAIVSIDTSTPEVMKAAVNTGASMINDVRALQRPNALKTAVTCNVPIILTHTFATPFTAANQPAPFHSLLHTVTHYLAQRVAQCKMAGIDDTQIILDPGIGGGDLFGKTVTDNLQLVKYWDKLHALGYPLLVGISRKSFIGDLLNNEAHQRLIGSLAITALIIQAGVHIVRTHDVTETVEVIKMIEALSHCDDFV